MSKYTIDTTDTSKLDSMNLYHLREVLKVLIKVLNDKMLLEIDEQEIPDSIKRFFIEVIEAP